MGIFDNIIEGGKTVEKGFVDKANDNNKEIEQQFNKATTETSNFKESSYEEPDYVVGGSVSDRFKRGGYAVKEIGRDLFKGIKKIYPEKNNYKIILNDVYDTVQYTNKLKTLRFMFDVDKVFEEIVKWYLRLGPYVDVVIWLASLLLLYFIIYSIRFFKLYGPCFYLFITIMIVSSINSNYDFKLLF